MSNLKVAVVEDLATADTVETKYVVHGSAKAWANLNGTGTIALRSSLNVSSAVDEGTGDYSFNFSNAFATATYTVTVSADNESVDNTTAIAGVPRNRTPTTGSVRWVNINTSAALRDCVFGFMSIHGDLA